MTIFIDVKKAFDKNQPHHFFFKTTLGYRSLWIPPWHDYEFIY